VGRGNVPADNRRNRLLIRVQRVDEQRMRKTIVTAAELRGAESHGRITTNGSLIEIDGKRWRVTRIESAAGGALELHLNWEPNNANELTRATERRPARPTDEFVCIIEDDFDRA
jgi:hypothetical protein